jgi:hypothetical protein
MRETGCDGCHEALGDLWVALDAFGPVAKVAIVCATCAPILERLDALVDCGRLDPNAAAAEFERQRWPKAA